MDFNKESAEEGIEEVATFDFSENAVLLHVSKQLLQVDDRRSFGSELNKMKCEEKRG